MADIDLPLWPFPPNWSTPIIERLEWLTDVLGSRSGAEQRLSLRLTPRRYFDYTVNPTGRVRSFFDQFVHRIADEAMLLPLWHDQGKLVNTVALAGERLDFDNTFREFVTGGLAVLYKDAFRVEVVSIIGQDDTGLDLESGVAAAWPKGTKVYPLRRAYMDPETALGNMTSRVGAAKVSFMVDGPNPYDEGLESLPVYMGHGLITLEPNRMDSLETKYNWLMEEVDNTLGKIKRFNEGGRAFSTQFYSWRAVGREQHHQLRQTLYRLKGRQKAVWMPTFNEDLVLSRNLTAGQARVDVQKVGYSYLGGPALGRDRFVIRDNDAAWHVLRINGLGAPQSDDEERLLLTSNAGFASQAGHVGSFIDLMRLEQDVIEITHHTDSAGVCEVGAAFKAFANTRDGDGVVLDPTTISDTSSTGCGEPGDGEDGPCFTPFETYDGWDYEFWMDATCTKRPQGPDIAFYLNFPAAYGGSWAGSATGGVMGDMSIFPPSGGTSYRNVGVRRINMDGLPDGSYIGNWLPFMDVGIINFFGESPENVATVRVYCRHWSDPFPGTLCYFNDDKRDNGDIGVYAPITKDWRDYR